MKFPKLPKNQKAEYFYLEMDNIVAVVISDELMRFYRWNKIDETYNSYWSRELVDMKEVE